MKREDVWSVASTGIYEHNFFQNLWCSFFKTFENMASKLALVKIPLYFTGVDAYQMDNKVKEAMSVKSRKFSRDILFHLQKRYQGLSNTPPPCQVCWLFKHIFKTYFLRGV